uniref:Uncharacterized protein n=1 Tax=Taeniopygia guttata TaxID=59729 RepID=A0A674GAZ2_TAEGU
MVEDYKSQKNLLLFPGNSIYSPEMPFIPRKCRLLALISCPAPCPRGSRPGSRRGSRPVPPARPASPWRCGWPRCWGPRRAGSPGRSAGTRGPASRRSRPPPAGVGSFRGVWGHFVGFGVCSGGLGSFLGDLGSLRSGSPARPNSGCPMVIFSSASSDSAGIQGVSRDARDPGNARGVPGIQGVSWDGRPHPPREGLIPNPSCFLVLLIPAPQIPSR